MKRIITLACTVAVAAGLLTACGTTSANSSGTPKASSTKSTGTSTSLTSCESAANKEVASAEASPGLSIPNIPGGISKLKGKSIWLITTTSDALAAAQATAFVSAAKTAGLKPTVFQDQSSTSLYNQGIQEAIAAHAGAIVTFAIQTSLITTSLAQASAAHIPVVSVYEEPTSTIAQKAIKGVIALNSPQHGKVEAAYAMQQLHCNVHMGVFYVPELSVTVDIMHAAQAYLEKWCPSTCSITPVVWSQTSFASTVGPQAVSLVTRDPSINSLLLTTDITAEYIVPALKAAGKNVLVIGDGGTAAELAMVASKTSLLKADDASSSQTVSGWLTVDAALRVMLGQPIAPDDKYISRFFDTSNIPSSPSQYFSRQNNYKTILESAWGLG